MNRRLSSGRCRVTVLLAAAAFCAWASTAPATLPGRNGLLAFSDSPAACPSYATNVFTVRPDGSRLRRLTSNRCAYNVYSQKPLWSPSGARMLYTRTTDTAAYPDPPPEVVVTRPDGSRGHLVAHGAPEAWGPIGLLAWQFGGEQPGIYVGPFENPKERFISRGYNAAWSPDGRSLAVTEPFDGTGCTGLAVYDPATGARRRAVIEPARRGDRCFDEVRQVDWSPNGRWFVFSGSGGRDGSTEEHNEIYVVDAAGDRRRRLTRRSGSDGAPVWSPDGRWIAYLRTAPEPDNSRYQDIYVMRRDGSATRRVARRARDVSWQPRPTR